MMSEGNYRHHCEQLRAKLADARPRGIDALSARGIKAELETDSGLFIWANLGEGVDSFEVGRRLLAQGHMIAPGALFGRGRPFTSLARFNVAATLNSSVLDALPKALGY